MFYFVHHYFYFINHSAEGFRFEAKKEKTEFVQILLNIYEGDGKVIETIIVKVGKAIQIKRIIHSRVYGVYI